MPNQPQASEDCIQRSFASLFMALLDLKGLLQPGSMTQPPGGLGHNISKRLANPFVELSTSYANQLARLYRTAEPQEQQVQIFRYDCHSASMQCCSRFLGYWNIQQSVDS